MNALTVEQFPQTQMTSNTVSVDAVGSTQQETIEQFIRRHYAKTSSEDGFGIMDSAKRAESLGFKSSANLRYAEFLEVIQSTQVQDARLREKYPQCFFLPWKAFHVIMKALDLWCELPEHYLGAVPGGQIPYMEMFDLDASDSMMPRNITDMLPDLSEKGKMVFTGSVQSVDYLERIHEPINIPHDLKDKINSFWKLAKESFFVIAPADAFATKEDFLSRFYKLMDVETVNKVPPNDPLVVRFCRAGALVVAAWGDEAAFINESVKELKL